MRHVNLTLFSRVLPLLILATGASVASSQDDEDARWFRVELMIISHETPSAETAERWDPEPALAYPTAYRFLVDEAKVEAERSEHPGESELDERGIHTITLPAEEESQASPDIPEIPRQDTPAGEEIAATETEDLPLPPPTPEPFRLRPQSELEFRGKAAYMQRTGRFRTLFHETWLQPMRGEADALPVIIDRSGDTETWPRLQGSLKLYLSRYLHLETNLWLNTAGSYLPADWSMPAPPFAPRSLIIIEPPAPQNERFFDNPTNVSEVEDVDEALAEEESGPVYPWRHAVLMQQKRRMRSNEVHYVDHPMLGVIVKLLPLTAEDLEDIAIADAELAADQPR